MTEYPILEEISNFFLDNLEIFLLVITPLALVVTYIGKKIYERIHSVEDQTAKLLRDQDTDLNLKITHIEDQLNLFDAKFRTELDKTDKSVIRVNDKHDALYKEFKNVQLDIVSELKVIRMLLHDKSVINGTDNDDTNEEQQQQQSNV
jgi:hypothetical protein